VGALAHLGDTLASRSTAAAPRSCCVCHDQLRAGIGGRDLTPGSMTVLSERDLRAVLDFVGEAYDAEDLAEFRSVLLAGIHRLVASDYVAYNEIEQGRHAALTIVSPELPAWARSAWERHAGENPLLQHYLRTRDGRSRRFSDVASTAELRRTALYAE